MIVNLENVIFEETRVNPKRQKLLGLVSGKLPESDDLTLSEIMNNKKPSKDGQPFKVVLMGTPDDLMEAMLSRETELARKSRRQVLDDFSWDYYPDPKSLLDSQVNKRNLLALEKMKKKMPAIELRQAPRLGKKLLVLDLDYTLYDCKAAQEFVIGSDSNALNIQASPYRALRRGTHEFLKSVYECYDLAIWSQTAARFLERKLEAIGISNHSDYKLTFVLDKSCMFNIVKNNDKKSECDEKSGVVKHEVKALELIWSKLPAFYGPENTVHVDDLARNFALNPNHGIKVKSFRAAENPDDDELLHLQRYLLRLSLLDKFDPQSGHKDWKKRL